MSRPVLHALVALTLAASTSSCIFAWNPDPPKSSAVVASRAPADGASGAAPGAEKAAASEGEGAKAVDAKAATAKELSRARKLEKRAHELEIARRELEIAELESAAEDKEAQIKLDEARRALDEARQALEHFAARKLPQQLADARLDLDRSTQNKLEAEQELREMEATYAKDQFALDTKELVLMRHRKRLEFATRGLELAEQRFADKERVELPKEQRELERKQREAEQKVREAEIALRKTVMSNEIDLKKKRFQVAELERPPEDEEGGKAEKNGKGDEAKKGS